MKFFIIILLAVSAAGLAVASVVFRSEGATKLLKQLRLVAFVYVISIMAAAVYRVWQQGGL